MKLFDENNPDYVRLDDDVSFQIVRTNPKLTTNTKLVYDGENLFMEAYPAAPLLSTVTYKHHRVWKTGLFNKDIRNFLLGSGTTAYVVGQDAEDTVVLNSFDNQYETMYWCGVESINSDFYPQEMGCIAPLYLRKKRPNYFVIFKVDTPANTNSRDMDTKFEFDKDVLRTAKVIKAFDLKEGTPIGNYIKRYVEQKDFYYDRSIYVNFSADKIYYYGIDKNSGVMTQKVENFKEALLENDNTIMKSDGWITEGFERNNLIFPYIINFEFLFDDKDIEEYKFARYFGMYCNDIDMYDLDVVGCEYSTDTKDTLIRTKWDVENYLNLSSNAFYYIKDKSQNLISIEDQLKPGLFTVPGRVNEEDYTGFETTSVSTHAEKFDGVGYSTFAFKVTSLLNDSNRLNISYGDSNPYSISGRGNSITDNVKSLVDDINNLNSGDFKYLTAFNDGDTVIVRSIYTGSELNNYFKFSFEGGMADKVTQLTDAFAGGTDKEGCLFKIYTADKDMFFDKSGEDRDSVRYLKCGHGRTCAEVLTVVPYIHDDNTIDDTYSILVTDTNGVYVSLTSSGETEIVDRFYPMVGVLSFFPVKDFDFDSVSSAYGDYTPMKNELALLDTLLSIDEDEDSDSDSDSDMNADSDSDSDSDSDTDNYRELYLNTEILESMPYARFYLHNNEEISTEYEYFFENILPELTTVSKTAPFIAKWGYIDDAKDSCENPYRLNTSKIFEACNFSANTFMQKGDIMEYTHSMPYYVNVKNEADSLYDSYLDSEYQYICLPDGLLTGDYDTTKERILNYFQSTQKNAFDEVFGDTSTTKYTNKRFNKKYSRFLLGNDVNKSSTLFRGVKFELVELKSNKEVSTGKYNDYKFSFIYVPVTEIENDKHTVYFVKNDTYKFIVGIVFFATITDLKNNPLEFNKAFVYAGCMGFLDLNNDDKQ